MLYSKQNLTRLVTSFLWFQNSIDQAVLLNKLIRSWLTEIQQSDWLAAVV